MPPPVEKEPWSLKKNLCDIAYEDNLSRAVLALGLASEESGPYSLTEVQYWHRAGAESWIYVFDISTPIQSRRFILKSYAPDVAAQPVGQVFAELLERRRLLVAAGARVPHLYGARDATVLEDFIPYRLTEVLESNDLKRSTKQVVEDVLSVARALEDLRFNAIGWIEGLLSDGEHAYVVDFGTDLGAPYTATSRSYVDQAEAFLWDRLDPSERSLIKRE